MSILSFHILTTQQQQQPHEQQQRVFRTKTQNAHTRIKNNMKNKDGK